MHRSAPGSVRRQLGGGLQEAARRLRRARLGAQQRQVRIRRQPGRAARSSSWLAAKASKSCWRSAAYSGCCGCQVCTHISLRAACAASRPARPAACISSANSRSGARKSLLKSAPSGLTAATSVMRRKSWPLATICVPTSTSTSPACTAPSCASQRALQARAVGVDAGDRAGRRGSSSRPAAPRAARCRGRSARCRGCRSPGRRAARAR